MKEGYLVDEIEELGEAQSVKLADDSEHVESITRTRKKCKLVEGGVQAAAAQLLVTEVGRNKGQQAP